MIKIIKVIKNLVWKSKISFFSLPEGCELTLAGDSLAVDGATTVCWFELFGCCAEAVVELDELFWAADCWELCDTDCGCWDWGCCCCWTIWLLVECVEFCRDGGLRPAGCCPPDGADVFSYMAALALCTEWECCPHQAPAVACDPAVTSWGS